MKIMARTSALFAMALILASCAKKEVDKDDDQPKGAFVGSKSKATAVGRGDPLKAGDGVIVGRVVLQGAKPEPVIIAKMAEHPDSAVCLAGTESEKINPKWLIGKDNGVANVVISLKPPAGKYFELAEADKKRTDTVVLDQPHCAFVPHIVATYPSYWDGKELKSSGQNFLVKNSAPVNHNTAVIGDPLKNPGGNQTLPSGGDMKLSLVPESKPIQVSCSIHPWMNARIWAFDNPYYAVTDADGKFEIKNVPTGVELSVVAWHEAVDYFNGGKDGKKQKFNSGNNTLDLSVAAK